MFGTNPVPNEFLIKINGEIPFLANRPNANSHFEHVNLLGSDFCALAGIEAFISYNRKAATMHFPSHQWE